ncbi:hypothetical protein ERJ75_001381300 [Trypanosoma vivax]|nr:hypothetical protein ERJ75_001381300 [Trypanosoma vivax]
MPRTQLSALLDHVWPAPKHTKAVRLSGPLLVQSGAGTSKHFGWARGVPARKADRLGCRWRGARNAGCDAAEEHSPSESLVRPGHLREVWRGSRASTSRRGAPSKSPWPGEGSRISTSQESEARGADAQEWMRLSRVRRCLWSAGGARGARATAPFG